MNWANVLTLVQLTLGYGFLCVLVPSVCLHDLVEGKSLSYRFFFYQACANIHLFLWGFILGYLKCFRPVALWITLVVFPLTATALRRREVFILRCMAIKEFLETILLGMYGMHALGRDIALSLRRGARRVYQNYIKGHLWDIIALMIICAVMLRLYGQYHLRIDGYAYGDENVHFHWEQELLHGNIFPDGMYPHGMHFQIAALSGMFGLFLSRVNLTFGCFNNCLLFCTLYLLLKETFSSKVAVLFGIVFFLLTNIFWYAVYHRYQIALPMEAGLIPYCVMFFALPRYLRSQEKVDFALFVLALGWCIHAHFYSAIAAAFTAVAFGIVFLIPMLKKKILMRVIAGGLLGILLGVIPFGVGFALGYPFQASMGWAVSVMEEESAAQPLLNKTLLGLYNNAFWTVVRTSGRILLSGLDVTMLLTGLLGAIFSKENKFHYRMILFWGMNWLIGLGVSTGVISLIQGERFSVFFGFFSIPLFVIPAQLLFDAYHLARLKPRCAEASLAAASLVFFFFMIKDGHVKDDFTVETNIISEGDIKTCYRLIEEYPNQSWTIVSTSFDVALVRYYGYQYEIIDLVKRLDAENGTLDMPLEEDNIYVPTKDVFVVVETMIDQYNEKKFRRDSTVSADVLENHGPPTPELALTDLPSPDEIDDLTIDIYFYPWRGVVMSKLYYWMEKVKETYPNEVSVFYQDRTVTVYHIHQDEYFPLDLMLDYQSDLKS